MSDFFDSDVGLARHASLRSPLTFLKDQMFDARLAASSRFRSLKSGVSARYKVLIVGVEVPARAGRLAEITARMSRSAHEVDVSILRMKPQGKFANVDEAIAAAPRPLQDYDWLVVTDDDVAVGRTFLDDYLALAGAAELDISQPAHRFASYASYDITRRRYGSLVRSSRFIEIGPITVLASRTLPELIPFPASRWCYGIDLLWSAISGRNGWRMGVVDGAPVRHLSPVARTYDKTEAFAEGKRLLEQFDVKLSRAEVLRTETLIPA